MSFARPAFRARLWICGIERLCDIVSGIGTQMLAALNDQRQVSLPADSIAMAHTGMLWSINDYSLDEHPKKVKNLTIFRVKDSQPRRRKSKIGLLNRVSKMGMDRVAH
jgi:hypothetical protein